MHFSHFSNYNYVEREQSPSHLWLLLSFPGGGTREDNDLFEVLLVPLQRRMDGGFSLCLEGPSADGCHPLDKSVRARVRLVLVEQGRERRLVLCGKEAACELWDGGGSGEPAQCPACGRSIPVAR